MMLHDKKYFSKEGWGLWEMGWGIMRKSSDPTHDVGHVERLIGRAKKLIKAEELGKEVDWEVLMLSIGWHDVWMAKNVPSNIFQMIWEYVYEGWGSAKIFRRQAKMAGLEREKIKKIFYAIKKHPGSTLWGPKSLEGKILRDVDNIDQWEWKRIEGTIKEMEKSGIDEEERKKIKLAKIYFEKIMKNRLEKDMFFDWSKERFVRQKEIYLKRVEELMSKYGELIK